MVVFYDEATGLVYTVRGGPKSRKNDPEATIDLARKFLLPPAGPPPTTFRYDTYDTTGEAAKPGSYAFLADAGGTGSAVTTYEGLRDGTTTALRIHETDAEGVSRAAFLDTVEVGDLFEWRQAEDCFVRYTVTEVLPDPSGTPRKLLGVEWMTYAFTGCSGAVSANADASIDWAPPPVTSPDITSPIRHGPFLLIPSGWAGELEAQQAPPPPVAARNAPGDSDVPAPTWPSTDIAEIRRHPLWSEPDVPEGWTRFYAEAGADWMVLRYQDRDRQGYVEIQLSQGFPLPLYNPHIETSPYGGRIHEATEIDGRPAILWYTPTNDSGLSVTVQVYDDARTVRYRVIAAHWRLTRDYEAVIAIARSLYLDDGPPTPTEPQTTFRYNTYDTSGEVAEPGSYAFLADAGDTTSAVTTYEGLRDGTATGLRIHETDADGVSRAAFLDTVEVGDLFEWRQAQDCFVRYRVTELLPDPSGTPRKLLGVEWMTYAFTGCSGPIAANTASLDFGELPDLGGASLTVPIRHGIFQIAPEDWDGAVEPETELETPGESRANTAGYTTIEEAGANLPFWRTPTIPEGWAFLGAAQGALELPNYGYCSYWGTEVRDWASGPARRYDAFDVCGYFAAGRGQVLDASWLEDEMARETRVIAGRPAVVIFSPLGPKHDRTAFIHVDIYDASTKARYKFIGLDYTLYGSNVEGAIAIARSLFESPNPQ